MTNCTYCGDPQYITQRKDNGIVVTNLINPMKVCEICEYIICIKCIEKHNKEVCPRYVQPTRTI